jgi:hypothetical protein
MKDYVEFVNWCENLGEEPTPAMQKYYAYCREYGILDHGIPTTSNNDNVINYPHPDEWPF